MSWTTLTILDGGGTSRTVRVWDESGAGTGPYQFNRPYDNANTADVYGEVQATPTLNTLLGRLKALTDAATGAIPAGTNNIGTVGQLDGPAAATSFDSLTSAAVDLAAAQTAASLVAAPGANKQIWVYGAVLKTNGTTATFLFQDGTPTDKTGTITLTDSDGFVMPLSGNFEMPWFKCATNTALQADTTGSGTIDGMLTYAVVDVS